MNTSDNANEAVRDKSEKPPTYPMYQKHYSQSLSLYKRGIVGIYSAIERLSAELSLSVNVKS
jgi:hypothetical protein